MPDINRKIETYSIQYEVTVATADNPSNHVSGKIWILFNLERTFYSCVWYIF